MKNLSIKSKRIRCYAILLAIFMGNVGYINAEIFAICPDDIIIAANEGQCAGTATWTVLPPADNPDGTVICTHESGDTFPLGTTTVTCMSVDASGNDVTCDFEVTVVECIEGEEIDKKVTLIVDSDLPVGVDDTEDYEGITYLFTDPATPVNATITNISIELFFRVQYASCESDIEIRLSDPAGNVVYEGAPFTTCNGSGNNPFPGELYIATIPLASAMTTGNIANWVAEFKDTNDQNPGEVEYTVRFGKLLYETNFIVGGSGENCGNPVILNCPESVNQPANINCGAVVSIPEPMFNVDYTDCFVAAAVNDYTGGPNASGFYPIGTTVVTWTFTDLQGNASTCEQVITIEDSGTGTGLECVEDVIAMTNIGECTATATWDEPVFTDCGDGGITGSTHDSGDTFPIGTTTVTYTAVDGDGNELTCSFDVIVEECDSPPPITTNIDAADDEDFDIGVNDTENFEDNPIMVFTDPGTSADAVLVNITLQFYFRIFGNSCESDIEIRLTDPVGNTTVFTDVYTTCDGEGPLYFIELNVPSATTTGTIANWVAEFRDTNDQNSGEAEYSVRWGNLSYDTVVSGGGCADPIIVNCPADITAATNMGDCTAFVEIPEPQFGADFTDCTTATITNSYNGTSDATDIYQPGTTVITWTATDAQGNIATCTQNITVEEIENIVLSCPGDMTVETTPGMCSAVATWADPSVTSNCSSSAGGGGAMDSTHDSGDEFPIGITTVTYSTIDLQGNEITCSFDVIVEECPSPPPVTTSLATPDDEDFFIGENDTENFADNPTLIFTDPGTPADAVLTNIKLELYFRVFGSSCENDIEVRLMDPVGNTNIFTPFTTCNGEGPLYFIELNVPNGATTGTTTDWVAEFRDTNDQNPGESEYSVRWGRLSYDTEVSGGGCTDPTIVNCPESMSVPPGADGCSAVVEIPEPQFGVDFTDCSNASITNSHNLTSNASGTYPIGTTMVIWTAADTEGNTSTCTQLITVEDIEAPQVACPQNIIMETTPGMCDVVASWDTPEFTDNCGAYVANVSHDSGQTFSIGTTTVTYNIADDAGNTAVCSFDIIVEECASPPPVMTSLATPDDEDIFIGENDTENFTDNPTLIFTDPGTPANAVLTNIKLELYFRVFGNSCENDIRIRLTDPAGNMNTFTPFATCMGEGPLYFIELTVPSAATTGTIADWVAEFRDANDQNSGESEYSVRWGRLSYETITSGGGCSDPIIVNCPENITVMGDCGAFVEVPEPQFGVDFTDCSNATITNNYNATSNASDNYPPGTTNVLWTAADSEGNIATCIQSITVTGGQSSLELTCPDDIIVEANNICQAEVFWTPPLGNNNCGLNITSTAEPGEVFSLGTTTVTYTATDSIGNTTSCSFDVIVEDNTAPIALCPPDVTLSSQTGTCGATLSHIVVPFYGDNCGIPTIESTSHTTSDVLPIGTTTVSYTLADASGNTRLCFYNVTVTDTESPVILNCPEDIATFAPPGECETLLTIPAPIFGEDYTDCVEGAVMTNDYNGTSNASGSYPVGTTTVVWTATDPSGNSATCEQIITIEEQNLTTDQVLVTDIDVFVGANIDNADFHQSDSILINDPGVPPNATVNSVVLDFFFSPEGTSCERDVELEVTDPAGDVYPIFAAPTNTCNGTDAIFQFTLPVASVPTSGGVWKLRFRDTEDHNPVSAGPPAYAVPPGTEYSVRFGRITYNVTIDPDCAVPPMLVDEYDTSTHQHINTPTHQLNNSSTRELVNSLKIFPVPTIDRLNVEYNSKSDDNISIEIINSNGAVMQMQTMNVLKGINVLQMELPDLPSGLYYIKLIDNKGHIQAKPFTKLSP